MWFEERTAVEQNNQQKVASMNTKKRNVGILIFDDAEVLDFAGPFEVFAVASQLNDGQLFDVFTVSKAARPIVAVNGLSVNARYTFANCPRIDVLIIGGGSGSRLLLDDAVTLDWIRKVHDTTKYTASICSGARLLAVLNLLNGKPYCTHHQVYEHMQQLAPTAIPQKDRRFIQSDERIYTSGGISAGIDLSFHIVEKLFGKVVAQATAEYMEYRLSES
jgi:transcriptional regulator GlxA family with amidase domain